MAVSESNEPSAVPADFSKPHEKKEKPTSKVVIRRLPPTMNKEAFLNEISPIPEYDYFYFVKGDLSLGEYAFSRAYFNFVNIEDIFIFKERFDGYVFIDSKGNEHVAVVEFAAFQRIPKRKGKPKVDLKVNTILNDPYYLEFVESLNKTNEIPEEKPEYSFQPAVDKKKSVVSTPLLEFIKMKQLDKQRIKDEKREEKRRRDIERKRYKDEERRKRKEKLSQDLPKIKNDKDSDEKDSKEKPIKDQMYKSTDYKSYSEKKMSHKLKPQYEKTYSRKNDFKTKKEDYGTKKKVIDSSVKDGQPSTKEKKVKKYSERRVERKLESKKIDLENSGKEGTQHSVKNEENQEEFKDEECKEKVIKENSSSETSNDIKLYENLGKKRDKENDPRTQRRIRNKDRPSLQIYQPGMLKSRKPTDNEGCSKESDTKEMSD